ncbi:peptidase M24, structural domain-containing protein [Phyllosticta citricarpa]|uniref:Xaa-Pro aminopeptidase n=2 Tax=Phyllosticta TaxID=121621 RepID=A0ABR1MHV0_9PEZI
MRAGLRLLHALSRSQPRVRRCPLQLHRALSCSAPRRDQHEVVSAAELQFGQPVHETHPHLLAPGELTRGITALEYAQRRDALAKALPPHSIAILGASDTKYRSGAVFYEFHQDPDFFYLTGFNEPDALAIIEKHGAEEDYVFHLYVRPKDVRAEMWEGARSGIQAAEDVFNADISGDVKSIGKVVPEVIKRAKNVYTDLPRILDHRSAITRYLSGTIYTGDNGFPNALKAVAPSAVRPLRSIMNDLRLTKGDAEIANMRKAGRESALAYNNAMARTWDEEKMLALDLEVQFKQRGLDGNAYVPVVAGGQNGLMIHYVRNDHQIRPNDGILVDAGGAYGGYITDITRTWPNNGVFDPAFRDLYMAVLRVQTTLLSLCRESARFSLDKLHAQACSLLSASLRDLGFDMTQPHAIETLFPHHVGHFIGLDVHDSPGFPRSGLLKERQCITIEPGVYVPVDDERWPKHFRGLAVRIEDSVCVGAEDPIKLTSEAVKEVVDIEALRRR